MPNNGKLTKNVASGIANFWRSVRVTAVLM